MTAPVAKIGPSIPPPGWAARCGVSRVTASAGAGKAQRRDRHRIGPGSVRLASDRVGRSVTHLYLFVFAGLALDTGAVQGMDAYPAIGVGSIRCVRYHLGDEGTVPDNDGVIVRLERGPRCDNNNKSIDASYGQDAVRADDPGYSQPLSRS